MKKYLLLFIACSLSASLSAQNPAGAIDRFRAGFELGVNHSLLHSKEGLSEKIIMHNDIGFQMGMLMEYAFNDRFLISTSFGFSLNDSKVLKGTGELPYNVFGLSADFMIHGIYRFSTSGVCPYILTGPSFIHPMAIDRSNSAQFPTGNNISVDAGFGLEKAFGSLFIAPELRYSLGLSEVNRDPSLRTLTYHRVTFTFKFKG